MSLGTKQYSQAIKSREDLDPAYFTFCCEYYVGPNPDIADAYSHCYQPADCPITSDELGVCQHCGTDHLYGAIFRDTRDGSYLAIGNNCADKFFSFKSRRAYLTAKANKVTEARKRREKAEAEAQEFLSTRPELVEAFKTEHYIISDINAKLHKWGSISDKQVELVLRIAKEEAERVPEPEPQPIPAELLDGRHEFTGVILGFKTKDTQFGTSYKMLFRDDRGFKLYGTAVGGDRGSRVSFHARAEVSDSDKCFGFYSRPTKVRELD